MLIFHADDQDNSKFPFNHPMVCVELVKPKSRDLLDIEYKSFNQHSLVKIQSFYVFT